jgi:alkylation response protein AidB-like acyl-CoA dehydrogenase
VGERGRGYAQFLSILDEGRVAIAALATGLAQGCVDESLRYAREREAFGHPIGHYQAIQFTIADMEARAHTARLAYYAAAAKMLRGEPFKKTGLAAVRLGETCQRLSDAYHGMVSYPDKLRHAPPL